MRRAITFKFTVAILLVLGVSAFGYMALKRIQAEQLKIECKDLLRTNSQVISDGRRVLSMQEYIQRIPQSARHCPATHLDYVYQPFSGAPRIGGVFHGEAKPIPTRMILWCPTACHLGQRHVVLEDGSPLEMNEAQFQAAAKASYILMR